MHKLPVLLLLLAGCVETQTKEPVDSGDTGAPADTGPASDPDLDGDGLSAAEGDCDDANGAAYPGAPEGCDGVDNDCDGAVDEDAFDATSWYADGDGDGFGDGGAVETACTQPEGFVSDSSDCDDGEAEINPDATERCDTVDNDCDALVDQADPGLDLADGALWYADADADGFGDAAVEIVSCEQPQGTVADATDCDDADALTWPGAAELCDNADNNCDGSIDDLGVISFVSDEGLGADVTATFRGGTATAPVSWVATEAGTLTFCSDGTPVYATIETTGHDLRIEGLVAPGLSGEARDLNVLDGGYGGSVVHASAATVSVIGLTLQHGYADDGGGVYVERGTLNLENCRITDNEANRSSGWGVGGGVFADDVTITSVDCDISDNLSEAYGGGGFHLQGGSALTLRGGAVSDNDGGAFAAIYATDSSTLDLSDCEIADEDYYGVYTETSLIMDNCDLTGHGRNAVWSTGDTLVVSDSTFSSSGASGYNGGGLYIINGVGVELNNITVTNNKATYGGGIYLEDTEVIAISGTVEDNTAAYGGGIALDGSSLIGSDLAVSSNTASKWGAGIYAISSSALTLDNTTFEANSGSAVYLDSSTFSAVSSTFTDNARGLYATGTRTTITLDTVSVTGGSAEGGAGVYLTNNASISGVAVTMSDNSSSSDGGAVYLTQATAVFSGDSVFSDNTANDDGGAFALTDGATLTLTDTTVEGNRATDDGGGLYTEDSSTVDLTNVSLLSNTGYSNGGGLYTTESSVTLSGCTVESNVGTLGGAAWVDATSTRYLSVLSSDFASNTADTTYSADVKTSYTYGAAATFTCTTTGCSP